MEYTSTSWSCAVCRLLPVALLAVHLDAQPVVQSAASPVLRIGGRPFRDLNRNGVLDPYEDWRLTSAVRAADLVRRMTLQEKAGAAVHGTAPIAGGPLASGPAYDSTSASAMILARRASWESCRRTPSSTDCPSMGRP